MILQKCLILRPDLKLQIVLLGHDFLLKNSVNILYEESTGKMSIKINREVLQLLNHKKESDLNSYFPPSFLAKSEIVEEISQETVTPEYPINLENESNQCK